MIRCLLLVLLLLSACSATSTTVSAWPGEERDDGTPCESPGSDQCVVFACEEGECGVFGCEDVEPEALAQASLAQSVELARGYRPPMRGPGPYRNWRRTGLRNDAQPRMAFHFRYRDGFLPAYPRLEGKLVKHHLFPQAREFRGC